MLGSDHNRLLQALHKPALHKFHRKLRLKSRLNNPPYKEVQSQAWTITNLTMT